MKTPISFLTSAKLWSLWIVFLTRSDIQRQRVEIFCIRLRLFYSEWQHIWLFYNRINTPLKSFLLLLLLRSYTTWPAHCRGHKASHYDHGNLHVTHRADSSYSQTTQVWVWLCTTRGPPWAPIQKHYNRNKTRIHLSAFGVLCKTTIYGLTSSYFFPNDLHL